MSRLSVIIPAYDAAAFISETIQSVLTQSVPVFEIIVVDDGSTDGTADILHAYGQSIKVISQQNQGLSAARNRGIAASQGDWLAFLDADDLWLPDFVKTLLDVAGEVEQNVGVIACGWKYVDPSANTIGVPGTLPRDQITFQTLLLGNRFPVMAAIVRRNWVKQVGGFDPNLRSVEDWDFWLRIALAGCSFRCIPEVLVAYRQVPGSMSRHVVLMRNNGKSVLDKIYAQSGLPGEMLSIRRKAYGLIELWAGANHYNIGDSEQGFREFYQALIDYPLLLMESETYHAIICAEQPREYRGTALGLNLVGARTRLLSVLKTAFAESHSITSKQKRLSTALAYQTLSEYALRQNQRLRAIYCILLSFRYIVDLKAFVRGIYFLIRAVIRRQSLDVRDHSIMRLKDETSNSLSCD